MYPPSTNDIAQMADRALATIPAPLRGHVGDVVIRIEEFPDEQVQRDMGLESPFDLLGLYDGVALTERSVGDVRDGPDVITLYRRPILDHWCETNESLDAIVRHVLIHEIGHHFGFSDDDMDAIERRGDGP